jgi:predicted transcriptional regulator of viral defense system
LPPKAYAALARQAVVTTSDAARAYGGNRRLGVQMLDYLTRKGILIQVRRGLYVPGPATNPNWKSDLDPYLVACRLRPGATIAFHSAFVVHGTAQNPAERTIHVAISQKVAPFGFEGVRFSPTHVGEKTLQRASTVVARGGEVLRVTRPEWTVAMCCRLVARGGGFEEICQSAAGLRRIDMKELLVAASHQHSSGIYNRVGFVAWWNRRRWRVQPEELRPFRSMLSGSPARFGVDQRDTTYLKAWNLLVPASAADLLEEEDGAR